MSSLFLLLSDPPSSSFLSLPCHVLVCAFVLAMPRLLCQSSCSSLFVMSFCKQILCNNRIATCGTELEQGDRISLLPRKERDRTRTTRGGSKRSEQSMASHCLAGSPVRHRSPSNEVRETEEVSCSTSLLISSQVDCSRCSLHGVSQSHKSFQVLCSLLSFLKSCGQKAAGSLPGRRACCSRETRVS